MEWAVGSPMPNLPPCWINCWSQGQVIFLMAVTISRFKVVFLKLWNYSALRVPWFVRNAQNGRGRRAWWWWTQALDSNHGWAVYGSMTPSVEEQLTYCIMLVPASQHSDLVFLFIMKMIIKISLFTTCHHTNLLQYYRLYSLHCTRHLCDSFVVLFGLHI